MSIRNILLSLVLCVAILSFELPSLAQDSPVPRDILAQVDTFVQNGDNARALSLLRQFVLEHPDAEQSHAAYAKLSRILIDEGRLEQARLYVERIPEEQRPGDLNLLLLSEYIAKGDASAAKQIMSEIESQELSSAQADKFRLLQAQMALKSGKLMQVLVYAEQTLENADTDEETREKACTTAYEALSQMDSRTRAESTFMFANTHISSVIELFRLEEHDPAEAEPDTGIWRRGEKLARDAEDDWVRARALTWLDRVEGDVWRRRALGIVLPLSGRYAPFGRMVKQGIELALEQYEDANVEIIVRDSHADVAQTETVMHELLDSQRVMAVLGPMTGEPATRAAQIAQEYRVPIILMSHWEGLPQLGSYVFRHSLTSRQQAEALANYAVRILGLETFALLQPENELGDNFSRLFRHAIMQMGAEVVYHRTYPQGSTDFRTALKPMMPPELEEESKDDVPAEEGGEIEDAKEALEPELEFEALFIPDFSETIALLAPQLAFSDIEDVQLLGINGWNSRKLLEQAGRYVRGAVFSDGFDPDSSDIFVQNFVTRYRQRYAEEPTILVAQAYDATNFLVRLLRDRQVEEPRNLRSLIPRTEYTGGVSGLRGFSADGEAMRDIVLFKIGRKKIERIDPAALQAPALEELSLPLGE